MTLQILCFCLSGIYENLSFGENYPLQFVPMLFSLKPTVYSYTLVTATFLHIGFWHLFGNVMFFLAFARTLERLFGTIVFLSSYVFIGALAYIGDWLLHPNSVTPIVGSSGAVSFLMGVYLMLFPKAKLRLIITIPPFYKRFWISAYVFLLLWLALQGYDIFTDNGQDGVAYATHVFGFILGVIAAMGWKEMSSDTDRKINELTEGIQ